MIPPHKSSSLSYRVTILGCGPSGGVPAIGNKWGNCDPNDHRNRRSRCAIYITDDETDLLIDPGPDLREQCLDANIQKIDAILCTHLHADHTHGIDDIRGLNRLKQAAIDFYADDTCLNDLQQRFGYAFQALPEGHSFYRPVLNPHRIKSGDCFEIGSFKVKAIAVDHGFSSCLSFRIGSFAYTTDVKTLPEAALQALVGIETWIVDCQAITPQYTHSHFSQTLEWIDYLKPAQAYLTHMGPEMDYQKILKACPKNVQPAYDGLQICL